MIVVDVVVGDVDFDATLDAAWDSQRGDRLYCLFAIRSNDADGGVKVHVAVNVNVNVNVEPGELPSAWGRGSCRTRGA